MAALAADLVAVLHLAFILWVGLGGFAVAWRLRMALLHLPALAWGIWISVIGGVCPLTPLEVRLRQAAGEAGYEGGFIEHYLVPIIYPPGLQPEHQIGLAIILAVANVLLYGWAWVRHRNQPRSWKPRT